MATNTTHYSLSKPTYNESADIAVINSNMDKIDSALWDSLTVHGILKATDDLNNLENGSCGIWNIGDAIPINAPAVGSADGHDYTGFPSVGWSMFIQMKRGGFIHQYILRSANTTFFMREYSGNPVSWGRWRLLGGKVTKRKIDYGSNSYVEYWKQGLTACVYVYYKATDGTVATWSSKSIATLPAGFRPFQTTFGTGQLDRADGEGTFAIVEASGNVAIVTRYNAFNNAENVLRQTITYPIADA